MYISLQYKDTVNVAHMYLVYIYMTETVFQEVSVDMNLISDSIYLICMTLRDELDLKAAVFCQKL